MIHPNVSVTMAADNPDRNASVVSRIRLHLLTDFWVWAGLADFLPIHNFTTVGQEYLGV